MIIEKARQRAAKIAEFEAGFDDIMEISALLKGVFSLIPWNLIPERVKEILEKYAANANVKAGGDA